MVGFFRVDINLLFRLDIKRLGVEFCLVSGINLHRLAVQRISLGVDHQVWSVDADLRSRFYVYCSGFRDVYLAPNLGLLIPSAVLPVIKGLYLYMTAFPYLDGCVINPYLMNSCVVPALDCFIGEIASDISVLLLRVVSALYGTPIYRKVLVFVEKSTNNDTPQVWICKHTVSTTGSSEHRRYLDCIWE